MKLKVCGMREENNIAQLQELSPDYMGFIFYEKSKRYVGKNFRPDLDLLKGLQKVGVFVNHSVDFIFSQVSRYQLDIIQLHGDESPDFCAAIKSPINRGARDIPNHVKTVKAFSVDENFNFQVLEDYKPHCDYFLFDTKGKNYGGNGVAFDWQILKQYDNTIPLFMSGGISLDNIEDLLVFIQENQINVHVIDVNSRFEIEPALKDIDQLKKLYKIIQNAN